MNLAEIETFLTIVNTKASRVQRIFFFFRSLLSATGLLPSKMNLVFPL